MAVRPVTPGDLRRKARKLEELAEALRESARALEGAGVGVAGTDPDESLPPAPVLFPKNFRA